MGQKRQLETDPRQSSQIESSAAAEDANDINSDCQSPELKRPPHEAFADQETTTSEDWTQNAAVIEAICERLTLTDLKSARLVCKTWATAGSVTLAYKSTVTYYVFDVDDKPLRKFHKYIAFHKKRVWDTGFRLRHVELEWPVFVRDIYNACERRRKRMKKLPIQHWLDQLVDHSELFQLMDSLKIRRCPAVVIEKLLLPQVLPRYWNKLKSLEFKCEGSSSTGFDVESWKLPVDAPSPSIPRLESLKFDGQPGNHACEFLKSCRQLQEIKLKFGHGFQDDGQPLQTWSNRILKALEGRPLKSLELNEKIRADSACLSTSLIAANLEVLRQLRLDVSVSEATGMTWFTDKLPAAQHLPRLSSFQLNFKDRDGRRPQAGENRLSPHIFEAFSQLHSKGYVRVNGGFLFSVSSRGSWLEFRRQTSRRSFYLSVDVNQDELDLPHSFVSLLFDSFPEVNYLCSPRRSGDSTTLLEVLGRGVIFKLNRLSEEWKPLQPHGATPGQIETFRRHLDSVSSAYGADFIRRNALLEPENFPVLGNRGRLYLFDTVTDLAEAWARVRSSDCAWSTIPKSFTPAIVQHDRGNYAFARFFTTR